VPEPDFLYALIQHNREVDQVRGLIRAIRTAVARTPAGAKLSAADLTDVLPPALLQRVKQTSPEEIKRAVLGQVVGILCQQGFRPGAKKAPLNKQLAKQFAVSEATMSRWLQEAGLDQTNPG